jgi:mannose-6-phosphate isomerase-like protein (cupin superfamily)
LLSNSSGPKLASRFDYTDLMARTFLIAVVGLTLPVLAAAQTPPTPAPARRPAPAVARATSLTFEVTDAMGAPLADVHVTTQGTVAREGVSDANGAVRFLNMRPGTYRVRFDREGSIPFEREVILRTGESLSVDVSLSAAPAPPKPLEAPKPPPSETAAKSLGPPVEPKVVPIPLFLEKNFIGREGRKESPLGCTSTATATLHQLREAWLNHAHDDADEWLYVVAGEGTLRIGTADQKVTAGTFSSIPHTIAHALLPTGRNPLIVISVLSGPSCTK